jgi:putative inorganic carbon (HCO3(-)) transporter
MIKSNPFFGIGPGNFQNKYLEYQKYFPPYLEWAVPQPHNLFLAFWLEAGVIGLIGFIWLLVLFFRDNKKAIENNRLYGTLYLAIILYFLFHGLIDTTYWRNDMAILFWMVVAINVHLARNQKASP